MALSIDASITFTGPALPDTFIHHELEGELKGIWLSQKEASTLWKQVRQSLRQPLTDNSGSGRVRNLVLTPITRAMGYGDLVPTGEVHTREGRESGGYLCQLVTSKKGKPRSLRCWAWSYNTDLDAPIESGLTGRYTPQRIAERVLLTLGEQIGLLTNGVELRLIISEAARTPSTISAALGLWKSASASEPPKGFQLMLALGSPAGITKLPDIIEKARLSQSKVTKDLRAQARAAVEGFIQGLLDNPANAERLEGKFHEIQAKKHCDDAQARNELAKELWHDALIVVYRLLFILSGEAGTRERRSFTFSSSSLWRHAFSPSATLGPVAQGVIEGAQSGHFLSDGLRALFKLFERGIQSTELAIKPLGGALFGESAALLVDGLVWDELSCAVLLDKLLRAPRGKGKFKAWARISYRDLDVEELGRVYEALLELEPGITSEPMVRLRRAKMEVVVPSIQGEKYRSNQQTDSMRDEPHDDSEEQAETEEPEEEDDSETSANSKKTKIEWIEDIPQGKFYLRIGLGRKLTGSFYTPESFVKFLVQETLGPQCEKISPAENPSPFDLLALNVLDPAMGSGHFLVGACRFLGEKLYEACRNAAERDLWDRIPSDVVPYMPGRQLEGESEAGISAERARALCKRLVAVHCLYGVDKNPLAVELAKVSLWLESFAEGLPLTFLDHRLVCGDSLLGVLNLGGEGRDSPFTAPYADTPMDAALTAKTREILRGHLSMALEKVRALDATLGVDEQDLLTKQYAKAELDAALRPFVDLCMAWSGGVMLGAEDVDSAAYQRAMELVSNNRLPEIEDEVLSAPEAWVADENGLVQLATDVVVPAGFLRMLAKGRNERALSIPLVFPEVFYPQGDVNTHFGFDAILANPPWDQLEISEPEFWANYDLQVLSVNTTERQQIQKRLLQNSDNKSTWKKYQNAVLSQQRAIDVLYFFQKVNLDGRGTTGRPDLYRVFSERMVFLSHEGAFIGFVVPSAFHSNEGNTGVRNLFLENMSLISCYSFENKRRLFDIHLSFKFAVIVATKSSQGTGSFKVGFYLWDDQWLFALAKAPEPLIYSRDGVLATGGPQKVFVECRKQSDFDLLAQVATKSDVWGQVVDDYRVDLRQGMSSTRDKGRRVPIKKATRIDNTLYCLPEGEMAFPVYDGKNFLDYSDSSSNPILELLPVSKLSEKAHWIKSVRYFRLIQRRIASSTNERTSIFSIMPPGTVFLENCRVEATPELRPNYLPLTLCAIANTFAFDFFMRIYVSVAVSEYLANLIPAPTDFSNSFGVHSTLRLVCNHAGYAPLWQEQLGDKWRESMPMKTYPVLAGEDARWEVRSAIDAVVAQAYGLSREQYTHVLSTFSHKSYRKAPSLCLAKFDELCEIGLDSFVRKYDPYWDVPLVRSLPQPVIELPKPDEKKASEEQAHYGATDLFGNPLETDLFGNIIRGKRKGKRR